MENDSLRLSLGKGFSKETNTDIIISIRDDE